MQYKKLYHQVIKNGGITLSARLVPVEKQTGFFVSLKDQGTIITLKEFTPDSLFLTINKLFIQYEIIYGKQFIGVWIDKVNEKVYIDVSIWVQNREKAIKRGLLEDQIAIWDIENGQEIYLKPKGGDTE